MRIIAICCALLLGASAAAAGPIEDCNQVRDPERQLRGCTAYIRLGKATPQNLATAHLNRANVYAARRDYRHAFTDYASAVALDPESALVRYNRGNARFDTKQYGLAIADFDAAIKLDPDFALAYYNRGLAHERRREHTLAAKDYRRALALDPGLGPARRSLDRLLASQP